MASPKGKSPDSTIAIPGASRDVDNEVELTKLADVKKEPVAQGREPGMSNAAQSEIRYDPFQKADLNLAEIHRRAVQVRRREGYDITNAQKCKCCGFPLDVPEFNMCDPVLDFKELGPGFPQYFYISIYIQGIILLCLLIAGFPCWIDNLDTNKAGEWDSENDSFILRSSVASQGKGDSIMPFWHSILHIVCMILIAITYHFMRRYVRKKEEEIDILISSPSDYTVWATNIDTRLPEEEIKQFFIEYGKANGMTSNVVKVNFPYDIKKFVDISRELTEVNRKITYIDRYRKHHQDMNALPTQKVCCFNKKVESYESLLNTKHKLEENLEKVFQKMKQTKGKNLHIGQAFVTFRDQKEARQAALYLKQDFSKKLKNFCKAMTCQKSSKGKNYTGHKIYAQLAPEPSDIIWENLSASYGQRLKRRWITYAISLIALGISFVVVYGCSYYQDQQADNSSDDNTLEHEWKIRLNSMWPSVVIVHINFILGRAIRYFSSMESHQTFTMYNLSVATKLTVAQCVNTALITMIVNLDRDDRWFKSGGLVADMTFVLISNAFIQPIMYLFSPMYMLKLIKMRSAEKNPLLNQAEANLIWEGPEVDMAQRYANLMKTLIVTLAYAPILPMGILISLAGLIFEYWIEKYLLIRRHKTPARLSGALAEAMGACVSWAILIYAIMNYVFMVELNKDDSLAALVWMIIVIGYFVLPINWLTKAFDKENIDHFEHNEPYENACLKFVDDYDRNNPITASQAAKEYAVYLNKRLATDESKPRNNEITEYDQSVVNTAVENQPDPDNYQETLHRLSNYALFRMPLGQYGTSFTPNPYPAPQPYQGFFNYPAPTPYHPVPSNYPQGPNPYFHNYNAQNYGPILPNVLYQHTATYSQPIPNPQSYPSPAPQGYNSQIPIASDQISIEIKAPMPPSYSEVPHVVSQETFRNPTKKRKKQKYSNPTILEEEKQVSDPSLYPKVDNKI
jgi:hypothetical protein